MIEETIPFPFQHIKAFLRGEVSFDIACDSTTEECYRLIEEYIEKHKYEHKTTYSKSEIAKEIIDKYDNLIAEYNKARKSGIATGMGGFEDLTYDLREEYGLLED